MDNTDYKEQEDGDIARLLQMAGPREKLPEELKDSWEQKFRKELDAAAVSRQSRRRNWLGGIAAAVALCAVAITLLVRTPGPALPLVQVSALSGIPELLSPTGKTSELTVGMAIPPGSVIRTGSMDRAGIAYAGYTLRLDVHSEIQFHPSEIQLHKGQLYASDPEQKIGQTQLNITTPHGVVRDIGTQFTVQVDALSTVATVRQGSIQMITDSSDFQVEAAGGSATRVSVDSAGQVHTAEVSASGEGWQWIYPIAAPFQLEGKSVHQFLQWSVSESGRELEFATASAELYARRVLLHGSASGLDPDQAVGPVLEATDLYAQIQGETLVIALRN